MVDDILSSYAKVRADGLAWIDEQQMIEVDRIMIEDLRIELLQMMENAGRNLARLVLDGWSPRRVAVAAGSGGNGGGGMVAARHLANAGVEVVVTTTREPDQLRGVPAHQFDILDRMGVRSAGELPASDVVVDAVIGYSLRGSPTGKSAQLIDQVNVSRVAGAVVVSLDTPSGLDVTTGQNPGSVVVADATMTLALPKVGMRTAAQVGALFLADISVPRSVTARFGATPPDFSSGSLLAIER